MSPNQRLSLVEEEEEIVRALVRVKKCRSVSFSLSLPILYNIYTLLYFSTPSLSLSVSTLTQRDSSVKCLSFSLATHRPVILYNSLSIQGGFARVYEVVSSDTTQPRLAAKVHFFFYEFCVNFFSQFF